MRPDIKLPLFHMKSDGFWLFDNGLWSLRDDFTVIVAELHFAEAGDSALLLASMKDRKVTLPADPGQRPEQKHLRWHREQKFLGC